MSHGDPFWLPDDGRHWTLNVSGGRSSGLLAWRVLQAHGGLPAHVTPIFANVGKEREQTLRFVADMDRHWQLGVVWVEYCYRPDARGTRNDRRHSWRQVDFATASRDGEPFSTMIRQKRAEPARASWWIEQEREHAARTGSTLGFQVRGGGYDRLLEEARSQRPLPLAEVGEGGVDCFCGD